MNPGIGQAIGSIFQSAFGQQQVIDSVPPINQDKSSGYILAGAGILLVLLISVIGFFALKQS